MLWINRVVNDNCLVVNTVDSKADWVSIEDVTELNKKTRVYGVTAKGIQAVRMRDIVKIGIARLKLANAGAEISIKDENDTIHLVSSNLGLVPDGVEIIDSGAFSSCKSGGTLVISDSVKYIDDHGLSFTDFTGVVLPRSIINLSPYALSHSKFEEVVLPDSITHLSEGLFSCSEVKRVIIPSSVKTVSEKAFVSCVNLSEVIIQGHPIFPSRGSHSAFSFCFNLRRIQLPDRLVEIPKGTFSLESMLGADDYIDLGYPEGKLYIL